MGFTALNFMSGNINYHNYGQSRWVQNSIATVNDVDILVFVISESHGAITWRTEYTEAASKGKNFIVLCLRETYEHYRYIRDRFPRIPDEMPEADKKVIQEIERIESLQITVVPYEVRDFKWKLKEQLLNLFRYGLALTERNNQKSTFLPVLKASNHRHLLEDYRNPLYESLAREILFDIFEQKELRKRTLDYFSITKSLTEEEIISLFTDVEDGISRKSIAELRQLTGDNHNLANIISAAIESSSENEVGFVRRVIMSSFEVSVPVAVKYLPNLFPCQDIGTPRRIINKLSEKLEEIKRLISDNALEKQDVIRLINLCLGYKSETEWKDVGSSMLTEIQEFSA